MADVEQVENPTEEKKLSKKELNKLAKAQKKAELKKAADEAVSLIYYNSCVM